MYSLPVNLLTINQFFGTTMGPAEAAAFIQARAEPVGRTGVVRGPGPGVRRARALRGLLRRLHAQAVGYRSADLPASILQRLPLRFNYEDSYFNHPYQGIPANGYTPIVEAILDHPAITVHLSHPTGRSELGLVRPRRVDRADRRLLRVRARPARLPNARLRARDPLGDVQGCAVMNYCDADVPYTRITEHKHFAPWESHEGSVTYREFSRACEPGDIPYYPVRLVRDKEQLRPLRRARPKEVSGVTFVGRLGTYRYLDMDVTIKEALDAAAAIVAGLATGSPIPAFVVDPLA